MNTEVGYLNIEVLENIEAPGKFKDVIEAICAVGKLIIAVVSLFL